MERHVGLQRRTGLERRTPLKVKTRLATEGKSESTQLKKRIQELLRDIVIARDGGCILHGSFEVGLCNGYAKDGHLVLQAEHLVERSNSATFADSRLVVCICKGHHGWKHFKKSNHDRYDAIVRGLLPPDRVKLWDACEKDSVHAHRKYTTDWRIEIANLEQELRQLTQSAA